MTSIHIKITEKNKNWEVCSVTELQTEVFSPFFPCLKGYIFYAITNKNLPWLKTAFHHGVIFVKISNFTFYFNIIFNNYLFPRLFGWEVIRGQTFVCMVTHRPLHTFYTSINWPRLIAGKYDDGSFVLSADLSRYTNQYWGLAWFNIGVRLWFVFSLSLATKLVSELPVHF